jgi:hypothetical protein
LTPVDGEAAHLAHPRGVRHLFGQGQQTTISGASGRDSETRGRTPEPQERSIGGGERRGSGRHMRAAAGPRPEGGCRGRRFKKLIG